MALTNDGLAVRARAHGGDGDLGGWQRLLVSTLSHSGGTEREFAHDLREGLADGVSDDELLDSHSAAGVLILGAGRELDAHGLRVGRLLAVEDLLDGGDRFGGRVSGCVRR